MLTNKKRGIAIPVIVFCIIIAAVLFAVIMQRSSIEARVQGKMFDRKMSFFAAEAGLNKAAAHLISRPFYKRWYLEEAGKIARGDKIAGIRYLLKPHRLPSGISRNYLDHGNFDVVLVERHKKFPEDAMPDDPVADGFNPSKVPAEDLSKKALAHRLTNAKVSHIDIYSRGIYKNPATGLESKCLLYGKFVIVPEPYAFEFDSSGDGKITYYGANTGDQEVSPDTLKHFEKLGNDYMNHPFLHEEHWKQYSTPDLLSQKPILARVIKVRAFYDKELMAGDLTHNDTLAKIKKKLAQTNLELLANFNRNRNIVQTFRKMEADQSFWAGADTTTKSELEGFLKDAGGIGEAPDPKNLTDRERNEFLAFAIKNFRYDEEGPVYQDLEFNIMENPLGSVETPKSKALGQIFNLDSLTLDQRLVEMLKEGKIQDGENLLKEMRNQQVKPLNEASMSTAEYIKRLSAAIQEYAIVTYPIGKVTARKYTADGIHKPPDPNVSEWYEYEIGSEFEEALKNGNIGDAGSFYSQMAQAVNETKNLPTAAGGNKRPTADLSPKPPDIAENHIPVLLVNKKDIRLTTSLANILGFYFKYIDFQIGTGEEDYLTADPGQIYMDPGYASKWKCKCLEVAEIEEEAHTNTAPSASHSSVAIGGGS